MLRLRLASANFKPQKIHPRLEGARGTSETVPSKNEWAKNDHYLGGATFELSTLSWLT